MGSNSQYFVPASDAGPGSGWPGWTGALAGRRPATACRRALLYLTSSRSRTEIDIAAPSHAQAVVTLSDDADA